MDFMKNKGAWDFIELSNNTREPMDINVSFKIKIDLLAKH